MTARVVAAATRRALALAVAFALAAALSGAPPRAIAAESEGSADVTFSPDGWAVEVSAAGPGALELVDVAYGGPAPAAPVRAAVAPAPGAAADGPLQEARPGLEVRGSTMRLFLARDSTLTFRLVADPGMGVATLALDGADATSRLGADGTFSMGASEARASIAAAFGPAPSPGGGPQAGAAPPPGRFPATGDGPALAAIALAAIALAAGTAAARARARRGAREGGPGDPGRD